MNPSRAPATSSLRRACRDLANAPLARTAPLDLADSFLDGLSGLVGVERVGLLLLDESTFEFDLARVRPPDVREEVEAEVSTLIDAGVFADALREGHPVVAGTVLLIPVTTGAVTAGMGVALLDGAAPPDGETRTGLEVLATLLCSRLEGRSAFDRASAEITEQRRIREAKDELNLDLERAIFRLHGLERQRDDLTRMIVHDLRTPMTSVKTTLDLMTRGLFAKLTEKEMKSARIAAKSADRLLGMINDLLDISKFEAGELVAAPRETDLGPLVEGVAGSLSALAALESKSIGTVRPDEELTIATDPDLLRRVVENLTGNALRFSPPDTAVTILLARRGSDVEIAVRDRGEGIPQEYQDRIFEKFVQVESRKRGRRLGTGLGLTFCQLATRAIGGTIGVLSEPGRGSTFTVRLPG